MRNAWGMNSMVDRPNRIDLSSSRRIWSAVMVPIAKKVVPVLKEVAVGVATDEVKNLVEKKLEDKGEEGATEQQHELDSSHQTHKLSLWEELEHEKLPQTFSVHLVEVVGGVKKAYLADIVVLRKPSFKPIILF
jgi:hypothetical protein